MNLENFFDDMNVPIIKPEKQLRPYPGKKDRRNCKHENRVLFTKYHISKGTIDQLKCVDCDHEFK